MKEKITQFYGRLRQKGFFRSIDSLLNQIFSRIIPYPYYLFLWHFDTWHRYYTARGLLQLNGSPLRILDVGGGTGGLARYLKNHDVLVAEPSPNVFKGSSHGPKQAIQANGTSLPFQDHAMDATVSLHVIEHIKPALRQRFLQELIRVTNKCIVIVNPEGTYSDRLSKDVRQFCEKHQRPVCDYALEHLKNGVPSIEDILRCFGKNWSITWAPVKNYWLDNLYFKFVYLDVLIIRYLVLPLFSMAMFFGRHIRPGTEVALLAVRN